MRTETFDPFDYLDEIRREASPLNSEAVIHEIARNRAKSARDQRSRQLKAARLRVTP